jgi:hypothetical protein
MASRWITITVSLALLGSAGRAIGQAQEPFRWSGVVAPGKTLEIRGINGDIEVSGAEGSAAEVRASKEGEDDDPREVRIEVVEDAQGVLVCAVYPASRGHGPNECRRDARSQQVHDNDVQVDFEVRVPAGVRLVARTVNGEIEAVGVQGDADVSTVNGKVQVASTGTVSAHTVNGSIEATMGRERWAGELEFHTVNGSVTLRMPAGTSAVVKGETVNGGFDSDFPLMLEANRSWGPRRFEGRIGEGGGTISIETVNGSIRLVRAS